jgi:DUF1009 family protein
VSPNSQAALGIIAGKGDLPGRIAAACRERGRSVFVLALRGETEEGILDQAPHAFLRLGMVGEALELLRQNRVRQIVMAGRIERPKLRDLKPDAKGAQLLARLGASLFAGDDRLLSTIARFLEEEGFEVLGADAVLEDGAADEGVLGNVAPTARDGEDIALGLRVVKALGALDIGQAVIIQHGHVLGVEAMEGTDALIARCAGLKAAESGGVLVKAAKPGQDTRVDLPAIGVETVRRVAEAGFAGIAVEAGRALVIDRGAVRAEADMRGVFVVGVRRAAD